MLIGVVSDTHLAGRPVPVNVLEALRDADMILHAGDIFELAVIEQLSGVARTIAVRGNMDGGYSASSLPEKEIVEAGGFRIGLVHGHGPPGGITRRVRRQFGDVDCIVFGHTHEPCVEKRGGVLFFNPGSPTDRVFASRNTVGFLELGEAIVPRIEDLAGR